ncbi:alpha/beta fold hydrolase [Alteribacillus sp. HJP-4]|uniref:alpha/beta fold hydrolase n=1 Tax=Alteribacillus sp. HJP-4 TaxID=2775394 RepID=UPI0035CCCB22
MSLVFDQFTGEYIEHGYVKYNNVTLHYVTAGKKDAPLCILLHGFPQTWLTWRYVIPKLTDHFRVAALDLRGYGKSDKPEGMENYDKKAMAGDIKVLLQHLNVPKALIAGHDRGGRVARRLALDYPEFVTGLVLIDILPMEYVYNSITAADAATKYWHWVFQVVEELPEEMLKGKEEVYLKFLLSRGDGLFEKFSSDGSWNEYLAAWKQPGAVLAALNDYRAAYNIDLPRYRTEKQPTIDMPALLLWGEKGNLTGLPVTEIWNRIIPGVTGKEIKNCGHYVPEEKPEETAENIIEFFKRIE